MLTGISLRNFKCFESADIPLGRITVLIGPNGTGKSSFLQALALLRQSAGQEQLHYVGSIIDMSSFEDVIFRGDLNRRLQITFQATTMGKNDYVHFRYLLGTTSTLSELRYSVDSELGHHDITWTIDGNHPNSIQFLQWQCVFSASRNILRHAGVQSYSGGAGWERLGVIVDRLLEIPSQTAATWMYTPVSRGFSRSTYQLLDHDLDELSGSNDATLQASGVTASIVYSDNLRDVISHWMRKVTGIQIDSKVVKGYRAFVRSRSRVGGGGVPVSNEGFGTNQLIYLLFQLAKTPRGGLDMIEEPEIHLHPFAIARLADLLVDEAINNDKQLLMTTHSEHLLLGLLNNVAEGKLPHADLVILSTSIDEQGAKVERVQINEEGMAEGGLPGFFDATIEAQRRHLDALMRRA